MVNLIAFDTEKELCELTGLTESELWEKDLFSMIASFSEYGKQMCNKRRCRRLF